MIRESVIVIHTVLFIFTIIFQVVFMAVDNGYGTRWLDSDNVAKYRHEVVFYVFEFACEIINLPMMLLFFFVASYQNNTVLTTHWQSYLERLQNVSDLHYSR